MLEGNLPASELFATARLVKEDTLKRDFGNDPNKLFTFKFSICSVEICPKLSGMLPAKLLY